MPFSTFADGASLSGVTGLGMGEDVLTQKPSTCVSPEEGSVCAEWPVAGVRLILYRGSTEHCTTVEWKGNMAVRTMIDRIANKDWIYHI